MASFHRTTAEWLLEAAFSCWMAWCLHSVRLWKAEGDGRCAIHNHIQQAMQSMGAKMRDKARERVPNKDTLLRVFNL
jgi:hypothetical protein